MTKHTPGPWKVGKHEYRKRGMNISRAAVLDSNGNFIVSEVYTTKLGELDETKANAILIAAAPALLDACKIALNWIEMVGKGYGAAEENAKVSLRAAITQAEAANGN